MHTVEFQGGPETDAHERFQSWRRMHPTGYWLNFKTKQKALIHGAQDCHHPGDAYWMPCEENGWECLTITRKVCADTKAELMALAKKEGVQVKACDDCKSV